MSPFTISIKTQTFQSSGGREVEIRVVHYLPTLQYVIPWSSITNSFPNAYLVKNKDTILPFLSQIDEMKEFLIDPLCIEYQENAVLEVIMSTPVDEQFSSQFLDSSFYPTRQFERETQGLSAYRLANGPSTAYRLAKALNIADTLSYNVPARSILSHTVKLQDASNPRLFIVLPTRDTLTGALVVQFRLYYLCECGKHTRSLNRNYGKDRVPVSHDVHLVDHEGYRIIDLPAFCEKYGVYALALLRMVKYGTSVGGMVVPRLLQFWGESQEEGTQSEGNFEDRVDFAINYMQEMQQRQQRRDRASARTPTFKLTADTPTSSSSDDKTDIASWLQWETLDELGTFIEGHDYDGEDNSSSNSTPGDLYRASSIKEDHAWWICSTHYNEQYSTSTRLPLLEALKANNGSFNERRGTAKVRLATAAHAADFYWSLTASPFLQHIHISLEWIAEPAEIKELVFAIQESNLQQVELYVQTNIKAAANLHNNKRQPSRSRFQTTIQRLAEGNFLRVQLKNRECLTVDVRRWPNTFQANALPLGNHILARREFPMLSELLQSASSHLTTISLQIDFSDFDALMDLVWPFVERHKKVEQFTVKMKDGSCITMDFKSGSATPFSVIARIPKLDKLDNWNIPLESISDLTLTDSHTLSEVDILVPVLIACCTSLNKLSLVIVNTRKNASHPFSAKINDSYLENQQPITLSVFELASIPTLSWVALIHSAHQRTTLNFPMTKLDLKNLEMCDVAGLRKILGMYPVVDTIFLPVKDLDDAYDLFVPLIQSLNRDMAVQMEQKSGSYAVIQFQKKEGDDFGSSVTDIQLQVDTTARFKRLPIHQVKTMTLLHPHPNVYQHDQLQDISKRYASLETLEVCCGKILPLSIFSVASLPALKALCLTRSDDRIEYKFAFPITKIDLAKDFVVVYNGPSDLEQFFKMNPELTTLSLTIDFVGKEMPMFLSTIKSLQGQHRLLTCTLKNKLGSSASITFADDNTISSYSFRLNTVIKQEDLQVYDLSSVTEFILTGPCPATMQIDSFAQEFLTKCPRLESIDFNCGSNYLQYFFLLCDNLTSIRKCVFRNSKGQVASSMDLSETHLSLGNEPLLTTLYPSLVQTLQARPTITGLRILVESTFEAYESVVNVLATKLPWLEEVKISQQSVGPKMIVSFANGDYDDCDGEGEGEDGTGRVSSIALDVRSISQLQPSMYSLVTKLIFSGQLKNWTREELDQIPLSSCENLSTLELKCPPSQFPRILHSMHESSLMHPALRCLKLWDGSRDNILTGTHIDDLDTISIRLQQVRMVDFQRSLVELEALLNDYPLEIAHLELDTSFHAEQAEIIEKSMRLGKVHIRHIQWDISSTKDVRLFEIMLRAVSHCYDSVESGSNKNNRLVPTVAFRVAKFSVPQSGPTMFDTSVSNIRENDDNKQPQQQQQQERALSTLGYFMTRFATHLILVNSGLEFFLPDLLATELQTLQELEIRVNRYCPDKGFLRWLKSVLQRGDARVVGQVYASKELDEVKEVEVRAVEYETADVVVVVADDKIAMESEFSFVDVEDADSDDYERDFEFDDPSTSSIIFHDNASTPSSPITALTCAFSPKSHIPEPPIYSTASLSPITATFTRQPLRRLTLHNVQFSPQQWSDVLESIDYLSLRVLSLERVGFGIIELAQLTIFYTQQVTRAREARYAAKVNGTREAEDDGREEEFVVRLYVTSVVQGAIDREHALLKADNCSQLKYILV